MERRRNDCDRERLRLSLEGRLTETRQIDLAAHLEVCAGCRRDLEQMAAASHYWGDLALLRGEPAPGGSPTGSLPPDMLGNEAEADASGWLGFLDPPDPGTTGTLGRLGRYVVLEVLGRGGMGTVLKACDPSLDRTVAIKVLASPLSHVATARRRFEREAKAVAAVGHEHIVAIHAVDEFRGLPYLVMEYVPGRSLQEKLDESGPLEVREIVRIGTQAARALAAAHTQGVVHRDIKPANILLENCIERVKLTDFGLARAVDDASLTHSGLIAGTPQYMAPEQARGEAAGLTQVSEFVATVFRIKTADGTLVVKVDDPDVKVQIDGDTVVIGGAGPQEIRLRAGSHRVRAIKDGKAVRDQVVTINKGGKEIVDITFEPEPTAPGTFQAMPTKSASPTRLSDLMTPGRPDESGTPDYPLPPGHAARARAMVWSLAYSPDGRRLAIAQQSIDRPESILRIRDLEKHRDERWFLHSHAGFRSVAFSKDGGTLKAGLFDGDLMTIEQAGKWSIHHISNIGSPINAVVVVPGSRMGAAGAWDGWVWFDEMDENTIRRPLRYPGRIWSLTISPDGSTLAIGGEANKVQIYDVTSRKLEATLEGFDHAVESLDFSPDGKRLASAGGRLVRIWDTSTWKEIGGPIRHAPEVICVRFSPDGRLLAISDGESFLPHYNVLATSIMLWDVAAGAEVRRLWGHTNTIWALAFSPDGKTLASGSADQTVKFWDVAGGQLRETLVPGESGVGPAPGAPDTGAGGSR